MVQIVDIAVVPWGTAQVVKKVIDCWEASALSETLFYQIMPKRLRWQIWQTRRHKNSYPSTIPLEFDHSGDTNAFG